VDTMCWYCGSARKDHCLTNVAAKNCSEMKDARVTNERPSAHPASQPTPFGEHVDKIVKRPDHYAKWKVEPITFIMENGIEFWRGNIIKYAARAGSKLYDGMDQVQSEITDLEKVRRYAEMRINQLRGQSVL